MAAVVDSLKPDNVGLLLAEAVIDDVINGNAAVSLHHKLLHELVQSGHVKPAFITKAYVPGLSLWCLFHEYTDGIVFACVWSSDVYSC